MPDLTTTRGRIESRSYHLHRDGYRATEWMTGTYKVTSPDGDVYIVDEERGGTCDCICNRTRGFCKHSLGLSNLLAAQKRAKWETDWQNGVEAVRTSRERRVAA